MADFDDRSGRDNRLLALVILIAVTVLIVLARFRFPPATDARPAAVTPGPLERLAARATYDDLAAAVHTALQRVEPALVLVTLEPDQAQVGKSGNSFRSETSAQALQARRMAGIRLDGDWAVLHVPTGFHVAKSSPEDPLVVRSVEPLKEIAVITRPPAAGEDQLPSGIGELTGFAYVCIIEPAADTVTASPWFVGRVRTMLDERWGADVTLTGGSATLPPGALVFQLDGRFLGLAMRSVDGSTQVVPASILQSTLAAVRGGGAAGGLR